jgi:hypothetical protein
MLGLRWGPEIRKWRRGGMNVTSLYVCFVTLLGNFVVVCGQRLTVVLKEIVEEDLNWKEAAKGDGSKEKEKVDTKVQ